LSTLVRCARSCISSSGMIDSAIACSSWSSHCKPQIERTGNRLPGGFSDTKTHTL
jgi:hypothetical protein